MTTSEMPPVLAVTEIGTPEDYEEYLIPLTELTGGDVLLDHQAKPVDITLFDVHDTFFYGIDGASEDLLKLEWDNGVLQEVGRVRLERETDWRRVASWSNWVDENTLLLGSSMSGKQFVYCLIDVERMVLLSKGRLDIPLPGDTLNYGGIFATLRDSNLYVSYTIYDYWSKLKPPPVDTMYLATISYPSMKLNSITKDSRNTFPGGYIMNFSFGALYEGDLYFITQTGGRTREHPTATNAVYRIKAGERRIDPGYEFIVAEKALEEAYGLYAIGDGKAITKRIRKTDIGETMDYFSKNVVHYDLLDLKNRVSTPIDLPLDRHDFRSNILVRQDGVFIAVYNQAELSSVIYRFDPKTLAVYKGTIVPGRVVQLFSTDNIWTQSK